jgi:hypothetical protein
MKWDMEKLRKWSLNAKGRHRRKKLPIKATPTEIRKEAMKIVQENEGRCPMCGCEMNQRSCDSHQISVDYINPDKFQIVCRTCNVLLGNPRERVVESVVMEGK